MSNEIGNILLQGALKEMLTNLHKDGQPQEAVQAFVNLANETKIYNLSDVIPDVGGKTIHQILPNMAVDTLPGTKFSIKYPYTPFVSSIFIYSFWRQDGGVNFYTCWWLHRLSEHNVIGRYMIVPYNTVKGTYEVTVATVNIDINVFETVLDLSNYPKALQRAGSILSEVDINAAVACAVSEFKVILDIFNALTTTNSTEYACYIDEPNKPKHSYLRYNNRVPAIKMADKPIILVLRDNPQKESKVNIYKRRDGNIQYAFSWVVRGHYRKLHNPETIGKDRNGDLTVQGYTWVETYVKGNLDAPILKREHVVLDKRSKKRCQNSLNIPQ